MDTDIKLGVVPCNSKIQVRRVVRNISDEPLVLTFKSSDCGCLSSEKKVCIEPKQEQTLHVNLDMHFVPQQISKRLVYEVQVSNVVMPLVFTCTANVQAILIKQREIPLGNLKPQEKSVLTIPRYKEDTWELMHAEIDGVRKEKILVDPNAITGTFVSPEKGGYFQNEYRVTFTKKDLTATISGYVTGAVGNPVFYEKELFLGVARKSQPEMLVKEWLINDRFLVEESITIDPNQVCDYEIVNALLDGKKQCRKFRLRFDPLRTWDIGMKTLVLRYQTSESESDSNAECIDYAVPLKMLVLP